MKILLVAPLYPPDVAEPAPYTKELASRLSEKHEVTVLTYGQLPEQVPGVSLRIIRKHLPSPLRVFLFTIVLWRLARQADILLIENGQSVEIPAYFSVSSRRKRVIFHKGDMRAVARLKEGSFLSFVHRRLCGKYIVLETTPLPRPELLPFESYPSETMKAYESSWQNYLEEIESIVHET